MKFVDVDAVKMFAAGFLNLHRSEPQLLNLGIELMSDLLGGELDPLQEYATAAMLVEVICHQEVAA